MTDFFLAHWLDITTTALGLAYILLEYKASMWLWLVGFVMELLDIVLYYQSGLYADCGMEFYYLFMTCYGVWAWKFGKKRKASPQPSSGSGEAMTEEFSKQGDLPITHFKKRLILPWTIGTLAIWAVLWFWLTKIGSTVPVADAFTTALSFVGIWALARKYLEQWIVWIAVDAVSSALYLYKGLPFKSGLYALYVVIAVMGYIKWRRMMKR